MTNLEKLQDLLEDVLLLEDGQFSLDLTRDGVETWDSMATVAVAIGVEEVFGHHPTEEEAIALASVTDIITFLKAKGVAFD
ncbi:MULTISPECIES: hypothetical protein [unclassified Ruegeria]|uniref:hypothetical protein n=1 Tax=unclassified Ruegeria TaxID=2625375 RepID=UPI001488353E|nr:MULTISPECIES: hypothetical protein [unclassified Ruegeria]